MEEWKDAKRRQANREQLGREIRERYAQMIAGGLLCRNDVFLVLEIERTNILAGLLEGMVLELLDRSGILDRDTAKGILREIFQEGKD